METLASLLPWNNSKSRGDKESPSRVHSDGDEDDGGISKEEKAARVVAAERLTHQRRLENTEISLLDCVLPIWIIAFLLVAVVSFTPLFSSFMAIYVVKKRVDTLVPKNLNVTAIDAGFVFESTFGRPIRASASEIATGLNNKLQQDEWNRRLQAEKDMINRGTATGVNKYFLPTMTATQKTFIQNLCNGWREQLEAPQRTDYFKVRATARNFRSKTPYCEVNEITPYCRWQNRTQEPDSVPLSLQNLYANDDNESDFTRNVFFGDSPSGIASMGNYHGHSNPATAATYREDLEFQQLYTAIDSVVRRAPIGKDFTGHGFVLLWGVDMNESGGVNAGTSANIVNEMDEYASYSGSNGLPFLCGWKYSGLKTARTAYSVTDDSKLFANFSWLTPAVPWGVPALASSCSLMCSTSYFGIFNISPPTSAEPTCNCQPPKTFGVNGTWDDADNFYSGANFDNSVTVMRSTPRDKIPRSRPNPFPDTGSVNIPASIYDATSTRTITYPNSIANYSNYLWIDSAQTFDTYSLSLNLSARGLLADSLAMAVSPSVNEHMGWLAYNLNFNSTFASVVNDPQQLAVWPTMMNALTTRSTLLDTDLAATAFAARTVKAPAFQKNTGRTTNCAIPRWFYTYERAPAPCGLELGFVPDSITLYRVTPVKVRRQSILNNGLFQESPVRVANVVVGRKIPIGLIQKVFWPLARQSAFQFSLVDATTMTEITCVDGTNAAAAAVFGSVSGEQKVRAVWSLVWNALAAYLPDGYVPLTWRYPFTSSVMSQDTNHDWLRDMSMDATPPDSWGPLPPNARCEVSLAGQTLDILSGRKKPASPFVDEGSDSSPKPVMTSLEDFTSVARVVFSKAYVFAVPIKLEASDATGAAFNPVEDLERTTCENYGINEEADFVWNRDPARPFGSSVPVTDDVKCGSGNNDAASSMLKRIQNAMRIESHVNDEQVFLTTSSNTQSPEPTSQSFKAKKNKGNLYVVVSLQSEKLLQLVLLSRSQVVVTSAVCAFIIVIALFVILRGLTGPIKQLRKVLVSATELNWDKFSTFNSSFIAEVLEVQYSMSYLTVKLQSFARFLPPGLKQFGEAAQRSVRVDAKSRRIYSTLDDFGSSSSDDDHASGAGGNESVSKDHFANYRVDSSSGLVEHKIFADAMHDDLEDDLDYENAVNENEMKELEFSGRSAGYARQLSYSLMGPSGLMRARKEAKIARRQAWKRASMFHQKRGEHRDVLPIMTAERLGLAQAIDVTSQETPLHSIYVNVTYEGVPVDIWAEESEKVQRRVAGDFLRGRSSFEKKSNIWDEKPLLSTKFLLKYRATDPLIPFVTRACREALQERPGENFLLFVDTAEGKQQVVHNEDLLYAFEQHASRGTLSPIDLTVAKKKPATAITFLIALLTVGATLSRIGLAFDRMEMVTEERVRLIGVLLIACLTMQLASNTLFYVYLLHRMSKNDLEFHMWRQVSSNEQRIGYLFSIFSIANFEILGCQSRFGPNEASLRFTAPFSPELINFLRSATMWSFGFSDFFPLVILWVETVLRQSYGDVVLWFTTLFCISSVLAILRRHGLLQLMRNVKPQGDRSAGPFAGKTRGTALLSRKEATVVRLRLAHFDSLLSTLDMHHVDTLCEAIYSIVSPLVRSAGGILVRADGLSFTVIFNAASNTPHHAAAAFSFVSLVSLAIKKHMSPLLAIHAQRYWQLRKEEVPQNVLHEYCARFHRVVAGVVTAEMAVGYSGASKLRTYQHADWTHQFAGALCDLAEHYGSEILVNEQCSKQLSLASEPTGVLARRPALTRQIDLCGLALLDPEICRLLTEQAASEYARSLRKEKVFEALGRGLPIHNTWKIPRELQAIYNSGFTYPYDDACAALLLAHAKVSGAYEAAGTQQQSVAAVKLMEIAAVKLAITTFSSAVEQIFVVQEPRNLQQYCRDFPLDEVAHRVLRWARFFGSPNQSEGIVYPRVISGMGVQPHPCELLHGVGSQNKTHAHAHAQARKTVRFQNRFNNKNNNSGNLNNSNSDVDDDNKQMSAEANEALIFHEALQESRRYFDLAPLVRPPRSERRMNQRITSNHHQQQNNLRNNLATGASSGGSKIGLIDYVLDQKQFTLTFEDRGDDEPVHEL